MPPRNSSMLELAYLRVFFMLPWLRSRNKVQFKDVRSPNESFGQRPEPRRRRCGKTCDDRFWWALRVEWWACRWVRRVTYTRRGKRNVQLKALRRCFCSSIPHGGVLRVRATVEGWEVIPSVRPPTLSPILISRQFNDSFQLSWHSMRLSVSRLTFSLSGDGCRVACEREQQRKAMKLNLYRL